MNAFTIKDVENLSGIKAHTIRIWEQRYSLLTPKRTHTNIRYYSNDDLKTILNISLLNKYGFKISRINKMSAVEMRDRILSLSQGEALQDRICNELVQQMIDLDAEGFEATIDNYIHARGIEKAIIYILFPFLERIGILWHTSKINPGQEHVVSNIIRQKLIVGIQSVASHLHTGKTATLFLPEGEHHELGLLFVHYLLKSRGVGVLYIGADVPLKDLQYVAQLKKPDLLYTHLTSVAKSFNFEKFIQKVTAAIPSAPLVVSGRMTANYRKKLPPQVQLKKSLPEVMEFISELG